MTETARLIHEILKIKPSIYHIDQSKDMSYYDVINYLKEIHPWITQKLVEKEPFNNQLMDDKLSVSPFKS
jgi:dTDP-4-dehydrorhamnose reductase